MVGFLIAGHIYCMDFELGRAQEPHANGTRLNELNNLNFLKSAKCIGEMFH